VPALNWAGLFEGDWGGWRELAAPFIIYFLLGNFPKGENMPKRYQQRRINRRLKKKARRPPRYITWPKEIRRTQGYVCNSPTHGGLSLDKWLAMIDAGLDPLTGEPKEIES